MVEIMSHQVLEPTSRWSDDVVVEARSPIDEIATYLERTLGELTSLTHVFSDGIDSVTLRERLDEHLPVGPNQRDRTMLIDDIIRLAMQFQSMTISPRLTLKLEVIRTDACRLFHADYYRQRLLCTYLGPGTEWLEDSNVDRNGLGKGDNNNIVRNHDDINHANTFDVLLLKGMKYGGGELAVIHRSPPILCRGGTRVLLKIDE